MNNRTASQGRFRGRGVLPILVLAGGIAGLLLLLHFGRATYSGIWFKTLYNTFHVPLFAVVGLLVFLLAGQLGARSLGRRIAGTLVAVAGLATISEFAQIPTARNASILDLLVDILSAGSAVMLFMATSKSIEIGRSKRWKLGLAGGMLLALLLCPLAVVSIAVLERDQRFPVLIDFDTPLDRLFARPRNADLERIPDDRRGYRARATLREGRWPGVSMSNLSSDWSGYSALRIELFVPGEMPLAMNVRIHDKSHDDRFADRYNHEFELVPGLNSLKIPLSDIETAPDTRRMDLGNVTSLVIFSAPGNAGRVFEIGEIRLE